MRIKAVTCVKNEGPFLLEWIAYNRLIGVTDHLFFSNDCTDRTDHLLDKLKEHGVVGHLPNPAKGRSMQVEALREAREMEKPDPADWLWIADVDEFLNIHVGNHTIPDLIEACGGPKAISITFQFMANAGIETFEDRPVIEQFTRTHNPDLWCGDTAIEVKSLIHTSYPLRRIGAHRPYILKKAPRGQRKPHWTDGSGRQVPRQFMHAMNKRRFHRFPAQGARKFATLNHYALRSLDSYLVKNDRGDVNRTYRYFDDTYWRERNDQAWEDTSILRMAPALHAEMAALKALPGVGDLHEEAVHLHREHIKRLKELEHFQDLADIVRRASQYSPPEADMRKLIGLPA
ncbi:MAG: glycosyltransferase family 2 protein [Pseudomonadota bacterium]